MTSISAAIRTGLVLGTAATLLLWYPWTLLILTGNEPPHPAHSVLATLAFPVSIVLFLAIGAVAARNTDTRSVADGARAGAASGAAAWIPHYVLFILPGLVLMFGTVPIMAVSILVDNPPSRQAAEEILRSSVRTVLWATPLVTVASGLVQTGIGALSGIAYVLTSRWAQRVRRPSAVEIRD